MVGRIYHVGLTVSDLDKSIAFYRDILGLKFQCFIFSSRIMKTETKTILLTLNELKRNKIRAFDQNEFLHDGNRFRGYADLSST